MCLWRKVVITEDQQEGRGGGGVDKLYIGGISFLFEYMQE